MQDSVENLILQFGNFLVKKTPIDSEDYNLLLNFVAAWVVLLKRTPKDELTLLNAEVNLNATELDSIFPKNIIGRN